MLVYVPFFKVIVLSVDIFESRIIDERHFVNHQVQMFEGGILYYHSSDVMLSYINWYCLTFPILFDLSMVPCYNKTYRKVVPINAEKSR